MKIALITANQDLAGTANVIGEVVADQKGELMELAPDAEVGGALCDLLILLDDAELAWLRKHNDLDRREVPLIVVTPQVSGEVAVHALRLGASSHLLAPVDVGLLKEAIQEVGANLDLEKGSRQAPMGMSDFGQGRFIAACEAMRPVVKAIARAAAVRVPVLLTGETGTGKDTVARLIAGETEGTFTVVDCTGLPDDFDTFECIDAQSGGSVLLDEIGDLTSPQQAQLLRALKASTDAPVRPRIIATTQYDLAGLVEQGSFRLDLFYRLNALRIDLPPLRDRGSDILLLAEYFMGQIDPGVAPKLAGEMAAGLLDYSWPGNVRELENAVYSGDLKKPKAHAVADQSDVIGDELDYYATMARVECDLIKKALARANGSRSEAARLLGINRQLLYSKLKAHGLMQDFQ